MEHRASPRDDRPSRAGAIRSQGPRSPPASVHGIRGGAAASMVRGRGADLRGAARGRGAGRGRHRQPAAARSNRFARRVASRRRRVVPRGAGGGGRVPELARARSPARRGLPAFPGSWNGFFAELASGYRTTGTRRHARGESRARGDGGLSRGSRSAARPIAQKVLLAGGPILASIMLYRALARITGRPARPCSGAVSYGLSATVLWASRTVASRCWWRCACSRSSSSGWRSAFGPRELPDGRWRFIAGLAVTFAVGIAFMPGVALAAGRARRRAGRVRFLTRTGLGIAAAAVRRGRGAPVPVRAHHDLRRRRGLGFDDRHHGPRCDWRGSALGGGPGTWSIAAFLPIAAVLAFSLVGPEHRGVASRDCASRWSPAWRSRGARPPATCPRGRRTLRSISRSPRSGRRWSSAWGSRRSCRVSDASRSGCGRSAPPCWRSCSAPGSCCRSAARWSAGGRWAARTRLPPAWAVVSSSAKGGVPRALGGSGHGGAVRCARWRPEGVLPNGASSLAVRADRTRRHRSRRTRAARSPVPGRATWFARLSEIVSGSTTHGGALLAPLGVRFVVAQRGRPPCRRREHLRRAGRPRPGGNVGIAHLSQRRARSLPRRCCPPTRRSRRTVRSADLGDDRTTAVVPLGPARRAVPEDGRVRRPRPGSRWCRRSSNPTGGSKRPNGDVVRPREAFGWSTVVRRSRRSRSASGSPDQWMRTCGDASRSVCSGWWRCGSPGSRWRDEIRTARRHGDTRSGTGHARDRRARRGRRRRVRAPARRRPSRPRAGAACDDELRSVVLPARRRTEAVEGHAVPRESRRRAGGRAGDVDLGQEASGSRGPSPCRRRPRCPCRFRPRDGRPRRTSSTSMDGSRRRGSRRAAGERSASARSRARRRPSPTWFAPDGTTEQGEDAYLVVMNPFAVDAVFDVVLLHAEARADQELGADRSRPSARQERGVPAERVR